MDNIIEKLHELKIGVFAEVVKKIEEIESISTNFHSTNLKIHNVSHYLYLAAQNGIITDKQEVDIFREICEMEYRSFEEWEEENLYYVKRAYIGRTSSFYYNTKWSGWTYDNGILEELLEGKAVLKDCFKEMHLDVYNYLVNYLIPVQEDTDLDIEDFEGDEEFLNMLSDDLDTVLEIVNEAKSGYEYLSEYKTEEHEYELAKEYLEHEITEYYCVDKADKLFGDILENIDKLNKVETLTIDFNKNSITNTYQVIATVNAKEEIIIETEISCTHELSEKYIQSVMLSLQEKINENFEQVHYWKSEPTR